MPEGGSPLPSLVSCSCSALAVSTATLGGTFPSSSRYTFRPSCLLSVFTRCGYRPACAHSTGHSLTMSTQQGSHQLIDA